MTTRDKEERTAHRDIWDVGLMVGEACLGMDRRRKKLTVRFSGMSEVMADLHVGKT